MNWRQKRLSGEAHWSILATEPNLWMDGSYGLGTVGARTLDGVDQRFVVPTYPALATSDFTFDCWIKPGAVGVARYVMGFGGNAVSSPGMSVTLGTSNILNVKIADGATGAQATMHPTAISTAVWYHVVATVSRSTNLLTVYLNGAVVVSADIAALTASLTPTSSRVLGGFRQDSADYTFNGSLSRARIAVGYAYTPEDVLESYNLGNGKFFAELSPSLAVRITHNWNLNEASGNAIDCVGTNDGVPTGTNTTIASSAGPREATASDLVGGYHGTLTGFTDTITPWSTDTPDGSYTGQKLDSVGTAHGTMTNFADVDAAHVDGPDGVWGPYIPDEGTGGNDGWLVGGAVDSRSADVPSNQFVGGAKVCFDEQYQEPQASGARTIEETGYFNLSLGQVSQSGDTKVSFDCWVKASSSAVIRTVLCSVQSISTMPGFKAYLAAADNLAVQWRDSDGNTNVTTTAKIIADGAWHHIAATWDIATGTINIWVDGAIDRVHTATMSGTVYPGATLGRVGNYGTSQPLLGQLSRLRVAREYVYTAADVAAMYNGGRPVDYADLPAALKSQISLSFPGSGATDAAEVDDVSLTDIANVNGSAATTGPYLPAFDAVLTSFASSPRSDDVPPVLVGKCKSFVGTGQAGKYATTGVKTLTGMGARSVSFWYKRDGAPEDTEYILGEALAGTSYGLTIYFYTGMINARIYNGASSAFASTFKGPSTSGLFDNEWHLVTFTWDGTTDAGAAKLYIDGEAVHTTTATATTQGAASTYNFAIHGYNVGSGPFTAAICRPQVWTGRALTAAEVATLCAGGDVTEGLTAEWRFMEDDSCGLDVEYSLLGNGSSRYVNCGAGDTDLSQFTLSAWFNPASLAVTQVVLSKYENGTTPKCSWQMLISTNGQLFFTTKTAGSTISNLLSATGTITANKWVYVALSYNHGLRSMYLDGRLIANDNGGVDEVFDSTLDILVGARWSTGSPASFFNGKIALTQIHNSTLTQSEIRQLAQGKPVGSPVDDWTFDERVSLPYLSGCRAISFDGVNDGVVCPTEVIGAGARSVSAWVYVRTYGGAGYGRIVDNGKAAFYVGGPSTQLRTMCDGATEARSEGASMRADGWHHVCTTWDADGNVHFYVDGIESVGTVTNGGTPAAGTTTLCLGNRSADYGRAFDGLIADVRIYSAELTQAQIRSLIAGTDFTTGMTARWKFGETPRSIASCAGGYSLDLNGSSDYVSMGDVLNIGTGDYSASIWVKTSAASSALAVSYIGKNIVGVIQDGRWTLGRNPTGNVARIYVRSSGDLSVVGLTPINDGAWHHLAATMDRSEKMRLYVDGVEERTGTTISGGDGVNWTITQPLELGRYYGASGGYPMHADAMLDDARIYRSVLSPEDVALLAAGGEPATAPTARWTLDDGPQYGEPSNGDPISLWESRDSERYEFEQATAAARPTYVQSGLHGRPGIAFDGVAQYLRNGSPILTGKEGTIVIVTDVTGLSAVGTFLAQCDESSSSYYARASVMSLRQNRILQCNGDTADDLRGATAFTTAVLALRSDGTTHSARVNGAVDALTAAAGANNGDWFGDSTGLDNTTIGAALHGTPAAFLTGKVYEILAWDRHLTDSELNRVERFLASKYGLTLAS